MFSRHTKDPVKTWRDFYFDLQTYFDGWLKESKVTTLEELKDLIVAYQIKKKTPQDYKDHFWTSGVIGTILYNYQSRRETRIPSNSRRNPISKDRIPEKKVVDTKEDRTPVSCYGCGAPGIIRSRCHTCNPVRQKDDVLSSSLNQSNFYSFSSESNPISIIQISICNTEAAVCADTGATHSVAGEKLYHLLKQKGLNFEEKTMQMTLADGRTQTTEILTTSVDISIQGKVIPTELLILKNARGYKPKPAGLLRTPVYSQRFEVIAIDLFGPLPPTDTGKEWIFIVEDCATKWVELFALSQASARQCATNLIEEVFMRHGIPRRIISDNGTQFVSAVLQQICFTLNISQNLIPVYSPQSNPVERKNRDLKPRLAILVGDDHSSWYSKLPVIRFAMNTTVCDTTGHTPAYLLFGRELRTVDDVVQDFKSVVHNDNFVAEITSYLK
ncbi:transposon Ty3-G Gag-Pol polyprotein [Trichonephila clavipes]|nr:transposon Ty3-G Gag-Pol polyprotein [Trichonephila clavipes]